MLRVATATKKRIVACALVALFVWPVVHHALVLRYQLNPWLLFGVAMYAEVHSVRDFSVAQRVGGRVIAIPDEAWNQPLRSVATRYKHRWRDLGRLADPNRFARPMLKRLPEADAIVFARNRLVLHRESARLVARTELVVAPRR